MKLPPLPNGSSLKLGRADGALGGQIWPAAVALCEHLTGLDRRPRAAVELGSGTGAAGLYAAALGFSVTLTEHRPPLASVIPSVAYAVDGTPEPDWRAQSDRLLKLLEGNVRRNTALFPGEPPTVMELDWTNPDHLEKVLRSSKTKMGFDLVIASDVTYLSVLHQPLADTIAGLLLKSSDTSNGIPSKCLISHQQRLVNLKGWDSQLTEFEKSLLRAGLTIVDQHTHPVVQDSRTHNVSILDIRQAV